METSRMNCLAIDGSKFSELAFKWYENNYHRKGDTLILLHIHQMPQLPITAILSGYCPTSEENRIQIEDSIKDSENTIEKFKCLCKENEIDYTEAVVDDNYRSVGCMICELAKNKAANIIVMGQRGLGEWSRTFMGSTSDYVLHHSEVPVIIVPPIFDEYSITGV